MIYINFLKKREKFYIKLPKQFYDINNIILAKNKLNKEIKLSYNFNKDKKYILLKITKIKNDFKNSIIEFFSIINNYPNYYNYRNIKYNNSKKPLISCIILLTMNDFFVKNQLIPSIIKNSKKYDIEIIIVDNSELNRSKNFKKFKYIMSEKNHIPKALNLGAKNAKGEYLAFFQDDVILTDNQWINKIKGKLNNKVYVLTTKLNDIIARNELLIIKKKKFQEVKGYDENIKRWQEDIDFSFNILNRGKEINKIDIKTVHFNGISSILIMNNKIKELISYNILSSKILRGCHEYYLNINNNDILKEEFRNNYSYLKKKYEKELVKRISKKKLKEYIPLN